MIRIHTSRSALNEEELNSMEQEDGLTLISVNHVLTHEYPPWSGMGEGKQEVVRWTYHFRVNEKSTEES